MNVTLLHELFWNRALNNEEDCVDVFEALDDNALRSFGRFLMSKTSCMEHADIHYFITSCQWPPLEHPLHPVFMLGMCYYFFQ